MPKTAWTQHVQAVLKRGGTMKQAAATWHRTGRTHRVRHAAKRIRSVTHIPRRRYSRSRRHRKSFGTQGLFKVLRIAALAAPAIGRAIEPVDNYSKVVRALQDYTGYDISTGVFVPSRLMKGYGPFLMTSLATYGIPKLLGMVRKVI